MNSKYSAMYYPDCYVGSSEALTTYLLIYDEIHLIALSDDATNPTERFRTLPPWTSVHAFVKGREYSFSVSASEIRSKGDPGKIDDQTKRTLSFYQFVHRYKELIGECVYFHPHLLASATNRILDKMKGGSLPLEDLTKFLSGKDAEMSALAKFKSEFSSVRDEALQRIVPTASQIAKDKELILVSDNSDIPVPVLSADIKSVKQLTSILAEECVNIHLPRCNQVSPEEILEMRESLKDLLVPFRMSLQKLSKDLRTAIEADADMNDIHREARFIAESQVEPAVFELKKKIEQANSKTFNKVFGKVFGWVPLIAKAYASPSPDNLFQLAKRIGSDSGALLDGVDDFTYTRTQSLCFLLKVDEKMKK